MKIHPKSTLTVLAATVAVITAACGGSQPGTPASSPPASTASPTSSAATSTPATTASASPASSSEAAGVAGVGRCHTSMLSARVRMSNPGAGQRYAFLVLTNKSGVTCRVYGYPGMQLIGASGASIPTDVVRTSPSPRLVAVVPGAHVYSGLHWTVVPATDETSNPCEPDPGAVRVTPPDETAFLTIAWPGGSVCQHGQIMVTPFKAGTGF